LRITGNG